METGGGEGSEIGSVMERETNKNLLLVLMPASPRTSGIKRRATTLSTYFSDM